MHDLNDLQGFLDGAWVQLARGVSDGQSAARFPTFATVSADGMPQARTVALRAACRDSGTVEVHTDIATTKVSELKQSPWAALHIWVPQEELQIRLSTRVEILTGRGVAAQWTRVPPASRVSYGTEPAPGTPIAHATAYEKPAVQDRFAVLRCTIRDMDLVHLGQPHRRARYVADEGWSGVWLAP